MNSRAGVWILATALLVGCGSSDEPAESPDKPEPTQEQPKPAPEPAAAAKQALADSYAGTWVRDDGVVFEVTDEGGKVMVPDGKGRVRLDYVIPARGLIGFRTEFLTMTSGTGLIYSVFDHYGPHVDVAIGQRNNGVLIANGQGKALGYALFNLQERGKLFIGHGEDVYEGMVIGIHQRSNDLVVNPLKAKQLTNIRAAGTDENLVLTKPIVFTLEQALEFIDDDELVEVTPTAIRVRKKLLTENERKRAMRAAG